MSDLNAYDVVADFVKAATERNTGRYDDIAAYCTIGELEIILGDTINMLPPDQRASRLQLLQHLTEKRQQESAQMGSKT